MKRSTKRLILDLLRKHGTMSLATVRPDGFPQATTVAYANDGLALYFACDKSSQKVRNIKKSRKVSLTIDGDSTSWDRIKGLSMGATARIVDDPATSKRAIELLRKKFSEMGEMSAEDLAETAIVEVTPKVISVIDYELGFGHTDLVHV
jgi:nitroimidazol reductase NimA-like FMN-containing flavoprotein (pyridoxamine 5'-phosphate oxidase superfamily)